MPEVRFPSDDSLRALLDVDLYQDQYGVRDLAIVRLLLSTGMRRVELIGMRLGEGDGSRGVDLESGLVQVVGKGGKRRVIPLSNQVVFELKNYLCDLRPRLPGSSGQTFWLGQRGPIGENTLNRIIRLRAHTAGLGHLRPHQLRHAWANRMLSHEIAEGDLMVLGGWSSRAMLSRYGAYAATDRALRAARRVGDPLERGEVLSEEVPKIASRSLSIAYPTRRMSIAKAK
jgi:integrase